MNHKPLIVITGAAGMIGSGVVRHLNDLGLSNLLLVDDLKTGSKWKNLIGKEFCDLISKHQLFSWLEGKEKQVDAILHLGACSDTLQTDGDYLLENNFHYTIKLCQWALKADKRFIYASSAATYGDGQLGFSDDESKLKIFRPLNLYGYSKHLVDLWMQREEVLHRVVGLKYFNVFGPNEYHKDHMASMVFKMMHKAKQGPIELYKSTDSRYEDGGQMRDFIYVKDAVKITCAFLLPSYRKVCGIFNVGRGEPITWNRLATALFKALKKEPQIRYIPMPSELAAQYQQFTCAEMNKLKEQMAFIPTPIEEAVCEYVEKYLLRNERW
jgi:ADP-L-glycero-D-manno-heptose 6-epimerase